MKLLFSIVSHEQSALTLNLIASFDSFLKTKAHEVLIVLTENTAVDNKVESATFEINKIFNLRPKGFGANHNAAFERFESDVFFIVNPDIVLTAEFNLDEAVEQLFLNKIDISSPKIFGPGGAVEDYKRANLSFLNLLNRKIFNNDEEFEWFAGMFLVVRSLSFRKLSGFDTDFFMYVEDCDLGMRARKAEMKIDDIEGFSVVHDARRASVKNFKHLKWHIASLMRYWFLK